MQFIMLTSAIDGTIVLANPESVDAVLIGYDQRGQAFSKIIVKGESVLVEESIDRISRLLQATVVRISYPDPHLRRLVEEDFAGKEWRENH